MPMLHSNCVARSLSSEFLKGHFLALWLGRRSLPIGMLPSRALLEYRLDIQNSQSYYCVNPSVAVISVGEAYSLARLISSRANYLNDRADFLRFIKSLRSVSAR